MLRSIDACALLVLYCERWRLQALPSARRGRRAVGCKHHSGLQSLVQLHSAVAGVREESTVKGKTMRTPTGRDGLPEVDAALAC